MGELAASFVGGAAGDDALVRAGVEDPQRFGAGWTQLSMGVPEPRRTALAAALLGAARPDAGLHALAELTADPGVGADPAAPGAANLARVLGGADFLARRAARMPEVVREVCRAAALPPREAGEAHARLESLDRSMRLDHSGRALRRNRYHEAFRLTARALSGAPGPETNRELADLADASLEAGLKAVERVHGVEDSLVVLAMGKLGGRELNYSSDVDLLLAHGEPNIDEGRQRKLSRAITSLRALLSETSEEGYVFRVDLDLRPEGRGGPLVSSADALVEFYERFGRTWERVAWIRARPCAGRLALGERIIRELRPFVYRRYGSYDVVQNVREVKQRIESDARHAERNVKLGPGGIREAEFVVQGLQALYGGRHESLRSSNTGEALAALAELRIVSPETARSLAEAYDFLRRVENALQMAEDRQTQEIPSDPTGLRRLGRRLGRDDPDGAEAAEAVRRQIETARDRVREAFEALLVEREVPVASRTPEAKRWRRACDAPGSFAAALREAAPAAAAERMGPASERLARSAFSAGGPGAAALASWPDAAPALALFLATDPELVGQLIRHPELLVAFTPEAAEPARAREPLAARDDLEAGLDALRDARRDASIRAAAGRLRGELSEAELERALTATAERVVIGSLALARHQEGRALPQGAGREPARLCILALGKLGSREMTFHSDLDLVFLYEAREGIEPLIAQEWAARLAQRVIHYLTTQTSAGRAYEVDTRLRPSGHGGTLVASLAAFRLYHERRAQIWEAQALLRARPVAGDPIFGERVVDAVRSALFEFLTYPDLAAEIVRMRARIEAERAQGGRGRLDLKFGPGGIVDAEFLAQYLALREGPRRPELRSGSVPRVIEKAGRLGLLRDAPDVLGALEQLRRAQSALRLVAGRPESAIELAGSTAALVAELVGAGDVETLAQSLRAAQSRLHAVFERELRSGD